MQQMLFEYIVFRIPWGGWGYLV